MAETETASTAADADVNTNANVVKAGGLRRKRKAHTKSRRGCANCKLRSVKCDEIKPGCKRCRAYGVSCHYGPKSSASEPLAVEQSFQIDLLPTEVIPRSPPAPLPTAGSIHSPDVYQLVASDMPLLHKFQTRTVYSVGSPKSRPLYATHALPIALSNPFLIHALLALTLVHETALDPLPLPLPSKHLTYHWSRAISLLFQRLTHGAPPVHPSEKDALILAAAFIGISSPAYPDVAPVTDPESSWPLRPSDPTDLSWLKLNYGKKQVWKLTDPLRPGGIFRDAASEVYSRALNRRPPRANKHPNLPPGLVRLLGLGAPSTTAESQKVGLETGAGAERQREGARDGDGDGEGGDGVGVGGGGREEEEDENPYRKAADILDEIIPLELSMDTLFPCIAFVAGMDPRFRELLEVKEEKALLLMVWWLAKACTPKLWWLWRRAFTEGRAICFFLERRWEQRGEAGLLSLLEWPKMMLGIVDVVDVDVHGSDSTSPV